MVDFAPPRAQISTRGLAGWPGVSEATQSHTAMCLGPIGIRLLLGRVRRRNAAGCSPGAGVRWVGSGDSLEDGVSTPSSWAASCHQSFKRSVVTDLDLPTSVSMP